MDEFIIYQKEKGITTKTLKHNVGCVREYLQWMEQQKKNPEMLAYQTLLAFIGHLQNQGKGKSSINGRLRAITHYYNFKNWSNVPCSVRLRGIKKEQSLLLTAQELDDIYKQWENPTKNGYQQYSNQLILVLVIYQGLIASDIMKLETNHINLAKGTLEVPGGSQRKRTRTLQLESFQIIPFHGYITNHRAKSHPLQTDDPKQSQKLFSPNCDKEHRLHAQFRVINKQLQTIIKEIPVKNLSQLQQSRIAIWIQQYGLRKAQYMAGYRSINQIEKYQKENPNDLKEMVLKYHPLR